MIPEQEQEVLEKLSNKGINDYLAFKKLKRRRLIEKFGFNQQIADIIQLMQEDETKKSEYEKVLQHLTKRKPSRQVKFFETYNINYETIFDTSLLMLSTQVTKMTPSKVQVFKEFKNQCLRLKYNYSSEVNSLSTEKDLTSSYMNRFDGYLDKSLESDIRKIAYSRIKEVGFEFLDIGQFGNEILNSLDIDFELDYNNIEVNRILLVNVLKKERKPISFFKIKQKLNKYISSNLDYSIFLEQLSKEGFIEYCPEGIRYKIPSIQTYIYNNYNQFKIVDQRLKGKTLEEIGQEFSVTRERIRQKESVEIKKIPKEELFESRYLEYFVTYDLTLEEFCHIFSLSAYQYRFLSLYHKKNEKLLSKAELMSSDRLTLNEREQLEKIINKDFFIFGNKKIKKKKIDLIEYLIEIYAQDEISKAKFYGKVRDFNEDNSLDFDFSSDRAIDGLIDRADNCLSKYGKKMIYYSVDKEDVLDKIEEIDFEYYMNQEISVRKILNAYQSSLNQIDIYDEYELHNLLKKYQYMLPKYVKLSRMPFIEVGNANREEQILDLLIELSPIHVDEFILAYSEKYGVLTGTIGANFLRVLDEFRQGDTYIADTPVLDQSLLTNLKEMLKEEFYFKEDIHKLYEETFGESKIPDYVFKRLGYRVYTDFILVDAYTRADIYFEEKYFKQELFDIKDKRLYLLGSFRNKLEQKKSELIIFQYGKDAFINIEKLMKHADIHKSDIVELLKQIDEYVEDKYFTYMNIEFLIEKSALNVLGFDPIFYESMLKDTSLYRFQSIGGTLVFKKTKAKFYSCDLLEQIVSRYKSIDLYDLIDLMDEKYSIKMTKEKIINDCKKKDLYFSSTMEMIFIDIEKFYEMMEE